MNDDETRFETLFALRPGVIARAVQRIEREHQKRIGLIQPRPRRQRKQDDGGRLERLHAAFARAARERDELARLKATGVPYAALDWNNPKLLHNGSTPTTTSQEDRHGD